MSRVRTANEGHDIVLKRIELISPRPDYDNLYLSHTQCFHILGNFLFAGNFTIEKEKFRMKENSGNLPRFRKSKEILQILISAKLLDYTSLYQWFAFMAN